MSKKRLLIWLPIGTAVGAVLGFSSGKLLLGACLGIVLGFLMALLTEQGMKK